MKNTMKKVVAGFLTGCMVLGASSITAFANTVNLTETNKSGTITVEYNVASSWTARIPAYINPTEQGNADIDKYEVALSDVMLGNGATLIGTVDYDGTLTEANDVELGYVLVDDSGEVVRNKEIIYADAGEPNSTTSYKFGAELNEKPKYAGNYLGTATFNFAANERVFAIGENKPENVIAKFNKDYTSVDIFTAGNNSDGIMKDFDGNSPMQVQALTLETATIDDGVANIGSQAFNKCESLESITIPNSVTSIATDSFLECKALSTVYGGSGSFADKWASDNGVNFVSTTIYTAEDIENDEHLFAIGQTKPEYVVAQFNDDYTGVTIFANGADSDGIMSKDFGYHPTSASPMKQNYETLVQATIKEGVTSIGDYAFYNCFSLESVNISNSVTSIGSNAFYGCSSLTDINIPENVTSIENYAFYNCSKLESIIIPVGVTSIKRYAFFNCGFNSVIIPASVISIDNLAFSSTMLKTIYGYSGSFAQTWTNDKGYTFVAID